MNFWRTIPKPIIGLAPMDGVTDASFRYITAKYGRPDATFTEFVNVEAAFYAPHALLRDLTYSEIERPAVAQIYGHTPELFYKAAHVVCELGFDGLDINMGCPVKTVASKGSGAGLILKPELARSIIRAARQGVMDWLAGQTLGDLEMKPELIRGAREANRRRSGTEATPRRPIPVSVKTRLGYDDIVVEEWIRALLEEKPAAITLHGRTLKQLYKGSADWEAIARAVEIAKNSGTLILGNGDLKDLACVCRRVRETHVDGVLIGRAAQGDPWIFRDKDRAKQAIKSRQVEIGWSRPVNLAERFAVMIEHADHFAKHTQINSFVGMRKHLAWYCKGMPGAAELRARMVRVHDIDEVAAILSDYARSAHTPIGPVQDRIGGCDAPAWALSDSLQP